MATPQVEEIWYTRDFHVVCNRRRRTRRFLREETYYVCVCVCVFELEEMLE